MADALIRKKYRVVILDNLSTGERRFIPEKAVFVRADTRKKSDVDGVFRTYRPDVVFHIAGQASQINAYSDPTYDAKENYFSTVHMAHAALRFNVTQFLYASSMTVYGQPKRLPVRETDPCVPISYYGISKYAAERFVLATSQRTDVSHTFHATSIRMYNIYGPRQSLTNPYQGVMAILMGNIARNEPITIYGDGNQTRDFLYIDDTIRLWMSCIDNESAYGEVFNGGCDTQISLRVLIRQLIRCFHKDPKTYPVIYKPSRPGEQRYMQADMKKAKEQLGFVPEFDLESGLRKTYLWIMKEQRTKTS